MTEPQEDRRSFASRTPNNDNPERVQYRRGFVTRHQVSGWRFVMRRTASGVALHDTRMLVDPLRTQTRAVLVGALVVITMVGGCFIFSFIRPSGSAGDEPLLADQDTSALYVKLGERLHPVLNLASARLILGSADNPTSVDTDEIGQFARGNLLGIPGAPGRMVQNTNPNADWTVCDATSGPAVGVTAIGGQPADGGERAIPLADGHAVLVNNLIGPNAGTWLLWDGRRSPIDLNDRAVTDALGLGVNVPPPRPIAPGLFNTIPEAPPLAPPPIPGAGSPPQFPLPVPAPVGAVVASYEADNTIRHYAVLSDGLQPISPVVASIMRNTDSYGLNQPPRLGADEVAQLPVARGIDTSVYPTDPVALVNAARQPVTCAHWAKPVDAAESSLTLLSGAALPVSEDVGTVDLVGAGIGTTANRVALEAGSGYFVQTVGQEPGSPAAGSLFWISDAGVRYGIDTAGDSKAVDALGLSSPPQPIPWSMLAQFAPGPTLSRGDALLAHDALPVNPAPGRLAAPAASGTGAAPEAAGGPR